MEFQEQRNILPAILLTYSLNNMDSPVFSAKPTLPPSDPSWATKRTYLISHGYSDAEATQFLSGGNPIKQGTIQNTPLVPKPSGAGMAQKGLSVSPDSLQSLRAANTPDGFIADQMAKSSPHFAAQLNKIRTKFQGDPAAVSAFLNVRFYGDANYTPDPTPENSSKGYIGRTLDTIYGAANNVLGQGGIMQQYNQGDINAGQAALRGASQIFHGATAPVTEGVNSVIGAGMQIPGVQPALQYAGNEIKNSQFGQAVAPLIQQGISAYQNSPQGSPVRDLAAIGQVGLDATTVLGAQGAINGMKNVVGATANAIRHPINTLRGTSENPIPPSGTYNATPPKLTGSYQDFVNAGGDAKVAREIAAIQSPEQKALMNQMTQEAAQGANVLGGTTIHRELAGQQLINNAEYVIQQKKIIGNALGGVVGAMGEAPVDVTKTALDTFQKMRNLGVAFDDNGKIISIARASSAQAPILQQLADFFNLGEQGTSVKSFKALDDFRHKIFEEIDAAKAGLAPTAGGQNVFSDAETIANSARSGMLQSMGTLNENYPKLATAYSDLIQQSTPFFKAIGYTGKMSDLGTQDLRAAEIALRTMGNASAKPTEALQKLLDVARKYNYQSPLDEMKLIQWSDTLESIFPITPVRSLGGQVNRAGTDLVKGFAKKGIVRGALSAADQAVGGALDWAMGMTPENRLKLLEAMLKAPPETSIIRIIPQSLQNTAPKLSGVTVGQFEDATGRSVPATSSTNMQAQGMPELQGGLPSPNTLPALTPQVNSSTLPPNASEAVSTLQKMVSEGTISPETVIDSAGTTAQQAIDQGLQGGSSATPQGNAGGTSNQASNAGTEIHPQSDQGVTKALKKTPKGK